MRDLEILIGRACGQLTQRALNRATGDDDVGGLLFFGNPMETIPRRLLLDERLSPVDKLGWMAFRMLAAQDRETSFPSYEALQRILSSRSDRSTASRSTVNRVVFILRLTRWLTLCHQERNTQNGRMVGNIYALHDEPISIVDASQLDTGYIAFVAKCRGHGHQSVRKVAEVVFEELADDQMARYLMTRLGLFSERLQDHELLSPSSPRKHTGRSRKADAEFEIQTEQIAPSSKNRLRANENRTEHCGPEFEDQTVSNANSNSVDSSPPAPRVRSSNSSTVRTLHTSVCKKERTARSNSIAHQALNWSGLGLKADEQLTIAQCLKPVSGELHQAIIDEAVARKPGIRNLTGYLIGLIEKAKNGEFKITQHPHSRSVQPSSPALRYPPQPKCELPRSAPANPVNVAEQLKEINQLLGRRSVVSPEESMQELTNHD